MFQFRIRTVLIAMLIAASGFLIVHQYLDSLPVKVPWIKYSVGALQKCQADGDIAVVHVMAQWDVNSIVNNQTVFETKAMVSFMKQYGVTPILADWTNRDPAIETLIQSHGFHSTPAIIIYSADSDIDPILIQDITTMEEVQAAIRSLKL